MKNTILLLIGTLSILGNAYAQQIANASFEQWDTIGDYTQPTKWYSLNELSQVGYDPSTTLTTDAHDGQFAVQLESKSGQFNDYSGVLCTGPILNQQLNADFSKMKVAFPYKPTSFSFYYKSLPVSGDSAIIAMVLTKWNIANERTDTIAIATGAFGDLVNTYTQAVLPFDYILNTTPDSMFIIASSSIDGFHPTVGSIFILDNMQLSYAVGLAESNKRFISIYPNPANDRMVISGVADDATYVLRDVFGKAVSKGSFNHHELRTDSFLNGVYFLELQSAEGTSIHKISIQH
jgi:hypothetical protein